MILASWVFISFLESIQAALYTTFVTRVEKYGTLHDDR